MMYTSNVLLSAVLLLSTCSAAPIDQLPLEKHEAAKYPFKHDPYDRKHDTYGDGVQPLPVVCFNQKVLRLTMILTAPAQRPWYQRAGPGEQGQRSSEP